MQLVRAADVAWEGFAEQRSGTIRQKRLISGKTGSPDNFEFSTVWVPEKYWTPRHRHIFDQIRFVRRGTFGYGRDKVQQAGEVSYFTEGTYYTQQADGESETLLLQFGSASGSGFLKREETLAAMSALGADGVFANGVYTHHDADGKKHNQDATEAIYQHAMQRPVRYPHPRYDEPIIMTPDSFHWLPVAGEPGVAKKTLGIFTERRIEIAFLKLDAGAAHHETDATAQTLLYALEGSGSANGAPFDGETAFQCDRGEALTLNATAATELFLIRLPAFTSV